jgi:hypothetical protein
MNDIDYSSEIDLFENLRIKLKDSVKLNVDYESDSFKEYLNKRNKIVEILKNISTNFNLRDCVYFLALQFADMILTSHPFFNYKIAAFSSFLLSSKFNLNLGKFYENDPELPKLKNIYLHLKKSNCEIDMKKSEIICLQLLSYKLNVTTAYDILELLFKIGICFNDEVESFDFDYLYCYSLSILKDFSSDPRYLDFMPIEIACSIVLLMRKKIGLRECWKRFEEIYNVRKEDFMNCYLVINTFYNNKRSINSYGCTFYETIPFKRAQNNFSYQDNLNVNFYEKIINVNTPINNNELSLFNTDSTRLSVETNYSMSEIVNNDYSLIMNGHHSLVKTTCNYKKSIEISDQNEGKRLMYSNNVNKRNMTSNFFPKISPFWHKNCNNNPHYFNNFMSNY